MASHFVSIVVPCMNEEGNVAALYECVKEVFDQLPGYEFEHIFIDNHSTDATPQILRELAAKDHRVKVIFNTRNFGQSRSPYYALLAARGEAVISLAADLQDPPELIAQFLHEWENGYKVVLGQKTASQESWLLYALRSVYYKLLRKFSDVELLDHVTGFGLYDREVIEQFRRLNDAQPYVRGLVSEFGYPVAKVPYEQKARRSGVTKNNFYTLFDLAMLGFTSHSKVPLRLASLTGFVGSIVSMVAGLVYLAYKLLYWNEISVGIAPLLIGMFFFASIQLLFLGVIGEYVGAIHTQLLHRPYVVEAERVNFDD